LHIQRVDGCDARAAEQQLRRALAEGAVEATWPLNDAALEASIVHLIVEKGQQKRFWLSVAMNLAEGTIGTEDEEEDDEEEESRQSNRVSRDRVVWVWKESIINIWKDTEPEESTIQPAMNIESNKPIAWTGNPHHPITKATQEQIIVAVRKFLTEHPNRADVHVMHAVIQDQLGLGVQRTLLYKILERPEFKEFKRKRGRPPRQ
jgi:hypothetical protein